MVFMYDLWHSFHLILQIYVFLFFFTSSPVSVFTGLDNEFFYLDKTMMVLVDSKKIVEDTVKALTAIKSAVEAGELDAQIETASGALRAGFKR